MGSRKHYQFTEYDPDMSMPPLEFNVGRRHVKSVMKKVQFLDIETSLVQARVFRTGLQNVNANQMQGCTKILTVAGGSMYDLYRKGAKGVWGYSNHHCSKRFKRDPLDDTYVLRKVWHILDKADVVVAHNGRFDKGWLEGRFLELGWKLPSKYSLVCTYMSLRRYNMTSKKLDELSQRMCGTKKISTDFELWNRCSEGERKAFEEMLAYNKGDIYDTMFKVYMRTCQYYPNSSVDMTDYSLRKAQCRVTGHLLDYIGEWTNHTTGNDYQLFENQYNGLKYRNRCITTESGKGKFLEQRVVHHV